MAIIVQKYGGSSLADAEKIRAVAERVVARRRSGDDMVVVVSAMGKTTDRLLALAREISPDPPRRELDMLLTVGERTTMALLSMAIQRLGCEAISLTGSQCGILTTDSHSRARIMEVRPFRVQDELAKGHVVIVAGYQGTSYKREITTLGRGGSDVTAVVLAAALNAEACEIYSDVDGVFSADPRVVSDAVSLEGVSYEAMEELARAGAKVLHREAVAWARRHRVALYARSTFAPPERTGTLMRVDPPAEPTPVEAVAGRKDLIVVVANDPAVAARVEARLAGVPKAGRAHVDGVTRWLLTREDLPEADTLLAAARGDGARVEAPVGSVTVVGSGLGEDPEAYAAVCALFGSAPSLLGARSFTALVPPDAVDDLVRRAHALVTTGLDRITADD